MSDPTPASQPRRIDWEILLVDDVSDNIIVIKTALSFFGATVHTATSGFEALEKLQTLRPTAVLLDLRMPKLSGWDVFKTIRANPALERIPVIAATAYAMEGDKEEVLAAGFDGYISKPFDMFSIVDQIQKIINAKAAQFPQPTDPQDSESTPVP